MEENDFKKLAKLCRIECTQEEKRNYMASIDRVLKYVEQLGDIPTEGVEPCFTVLETVSSPLREDVVGETLPREVFLANAPSHVGGMVRVPPVLKEQDV